MISKNHVDVRTAENAASQWEVVDPEFEETDDPVDEEPFTAEELRQLALAAGFQVLT